MTDAANPFEEVRRSVLAALRDPTSLVRLTPGQLDFTLRVTRRAQVLGRIAFTLRECGLTASLPLAAQDALAGALMLAESRSRVALWELNRIGWALRDGPDVPLIVMKGCAYALMGLPNGTARLFADVDLLAPEASLPAIESRLSDCGWVCAELTPYDANYYRLWTHELPPMTHFEREVEVDLHHNLVMRTARLKPDARKLLAHARRVPGTRFSVLAPTDMVLHAITHLFFTSEIDDAVREVLDIDQMLRHFGEHEPGFWERLWPRAVDLDLARPAFYGLRYAARILETPIPEAVLRASRAAAPAAPILALMDALVPRAVFPQHPDRHSLAAATARLLLFVRCHWLRMPPLMLARHLSHKFYVRHLQRPEPVL